MSHHFDSPEAREDSRIDLTDIYLFGSGDPSRMVAVMCASPLAGLPSPYHGRPQAETFRPNTAYDFRFDTDGDARGDVAFRFIFTGEDRPQEWTLQYLSGATEAQGASSQGRVLGTGSTESTTDVEGLGRVWAGLAGDPFWLDAVPLPAFIKRVAAGEWSPDSFSSGTVTTAGTNVIAVVAELPLSMISTGPMGFYATVSADDHGVWTRVQRCGRPNIAATFNDDPARSLLYNSTEPSTDYDNFAGTVRSTVASLVRTARTATDPEGYGELVARTLLPDLIPYDPVLPASYGFARVNGRALRDDFGAVMYSTVFNYPMRTAIEPLTDLQDDWPFLPPARPRPSGPAVAVPERASS